MSDGKPNKEPTPQIDRVAGRDIVITPLTGVIAVAALGSVSTLLKLTLDLAKAAKRDEVEAVLATKYAQRHIVKREADTIFVDGVGLRFRDDELVGIVFMNEAATHH